MAAQAAPSYSPVAGDADGVATENCEPSQQSPRPHLSLRIGVLVTVATAVALFVAAVQPFLPPGETEGREGTTSLESWVASIASWRSRSSLHEAVRERERRRERERLHERERERKECDPEIEKVNSEMYEAYWVSYPACKGTRNFSKASEDCLEAARDANLQGLPAWVENYHTGNCTDEEHMLCNITMSLGGLDYYRGKCFPNRCQPEATLLTLAQDAKNSGLCSKSATAANVTVALSGRNAVVARLMNAVAKARSHSAVVVSLLLLF